MLNSPLTSVLKLSQKLLSNQRKEFVKNRSKQYLHLLGQTSFLSALTKANKKGDAILMENMLVRVSKVLADHDDLLKYNLNPAPYNVCTA